MFVMMLHPPPRFERTKLKQRSEKWGIVKKRWGMSSLSEEEVGVRVGVGARVVGAAVRVGV